MAILHDNLNDNLSYQDAAPEVFSEMRARLDTLTRKIAHYRAEAREFRELADVRDGYAEQLNGLVRQYEQSMEVLSRAAALDSDGS